MWTATEAGSVQAAASQDKPSGIGWSRVVGVARYSAAPPFAWTPWTRRFRQTWDAPSRHARQVPQTSSGSTATRCPAASRPVVSSTTSPTSSCPTTTGGRTADISPCQRWRSVPQMPA